MADPFKATINTIDKYALEYETKYMNYGPYLDTYGVLSDLLSADASGLQTRNNVDWLCTYYHDADLMVGTLKATGFEVVDLIRKPFEKTGEPDASDVFIYARAS